jgi:hypothetical protein
MRARSRLRYGVGRGAARHSPHRSVCRCDRRRLDTAGRGGIVNEQSCDTARKRGLLDDRSRGENTKNRL